MPNILDTARHPTKANGDALPALRLFEDYVTESSECLRRARDALASVPSDFWKGITHYFVVASLGGQNIGKSYLLNVLFGLEFRVVNGLGTAYIDMAFARLGSVLFIVLDTEGNNSAVEQQREAAHIDHGASGEGIRSNFVVASAHMLLLSFRFHDRHHFQGFTSELDNLFQSAQRDGAATDRCLVILAVRDIDAEFRDSDIAAQGAEDILRMAEQRREHHIQQNPRWTTQLKRFVFRVILLCHPREHHHPDTPPILARQQKSAHDRFVERARNGVSKILSSGDIAGMGGLWRGWQLYLDVLAEAMSGAWRPPYVINVAERFARRYRIDEVVKDVRERIDSSILEAHKYLVKLRQPWTCSVIYTHCCQPLDIEWTNDEQMQRRCAQNVYVNLTALMVTRAKLTEEETVSAFVKEYWAKLRIDIDATVAALWSKNHSLMDAQLQSRIGRIQVRVDQFLYGIGNQDPDAHVQAILDKTPSLRKGSDDTFVSLWPAFYVGRVQLTADIECLLDVFIRSIDSTWSHKATLARDKLLGELNEGFDRENTTWRQVLIGIPDWFADVARVTGTCANYIANPVIGAIGGSPFGPPGMVVGALGGGASAHWVSKEPVQRATAGLGRRIGKLWQAALQKVTTQKLSKATDRRHGMI